MLILWFFFPILSRIISITGENTSNTQLHIFVLFREISRGTERINYRTRLEINSVSIQPAGNQWLMEAI